MSFPFVELYKHTTIPSKSSLYFVSFSLLKVPFRFTENDGRYSACSDTTELDNHRSSLSFSWWHHHLVTIDSIILHFYLDNILFDRRPLNNTPSGTTIQIQVRQRYSWRRGAAMCTDATIIAQGLIGDASTAGCRSGFCTGWSAPSTRTACTDFGVNLDVSSWEILNLRTVNLNVAFSIGFVSTAWFATLVVCANSNWNVITRINTATRPDGLINSNPIATTVPIIYKAVGVTHVHVVQMSDFDGTDVLRCRCSTSATTNFNNFNECGGVSNGVPGAVLFQNNCTMRFSLVTPTWYAAAVTPMSSVGLQFLFYGYTVPDVCSTPPTIIGV